MGKDFDEHPASVITRMTVMWPMCGGGLPCHQQRQYGDKCLEAFDGSYERTAYINEAKALRCMVYYNLSQLWGQCALHYGARHFQQLR